MPSIRTPRRLRPLPLAVALLALAACAGAPSSEPAVPRDAGRDGADATPSPDVTVDAAADGAARDVAATDAAAPPDVWAGPWTCPTDMALVETAALVACVDRYEAARPDATWYDAGTDERRAVSRAEVLPWIVGDDRPAAAAACVAAGKRLCGAAEWQAACAGPDGRAYPYGETYREDMCNGFETHGPGSFQLVPTGQMEHCESGFGVFDMSGNLWELVRTGDDVVPRGGAFDSTDGPYTHRCSYVRSGGNFPSLGFRCCADPTPDR